MPFDVHRIGTSGGTSLAILRRYRREYWTGTAWITNVGLSSASLASVVAAINSGSSTSLRYRG